MAADRGEYREAAGGLEDIAVEFNGKTQAGPNKSHPTVGGYSSRRATNNSRVPQLASDLGSFEVSPCVDPQQQ